MTDGSEDTNLNGVRPLRTGNAGAEQRLANAQELQETFRRFVGESFYGQLLKSIAHCASS